MGSPHCQSVRGLTYVGAGTITYKFLQILVSTTIYIFVQSIFTWKLNLLIYVHVPKLIVSKHFCSPSIYKRVVVTFGMTVHMANFYLNACKLSHLVSSCVFLLTNLLGGGTSLCGAVTYVTTSSTSGGSVCA